mgnify:CR=1 FL=1
MQFLLNLLKIDTAMEDLVTRIDTVEGDVVVTWEFYCNLTNRFRSERCRSIFEEHFIATYKKIIGCC